MDADVRERQTPAVEPLNKQIDQRLHRELEARISYFGRHTDQIGLRLQELDREWDIERILQTNAAGASLFGICMARRHYKWLALPFAAAVFLMQHAIQGWCPPMEILRRAGFRTREEINEERIALRVLRGDFNDGLDAHAVQAACGGEGESQVPGDSP